MESGVDAVILTTPPHFRATHFQYAVELGKHVFMEKPARGGRAGHPANPGHQCRGERKDLRVAVGFQNRHNPRIQETIQRLRDGAIGPIKLMRAYWKRGALARTPPRPPKCRKCSTSCAIPTTSSG